MFCLSFRLGMWWSAGTLTFTLNGEFLREVQTKLRGIYLPVLCVCAPVGRPAHVPLVLVTNFGAKPFRTDLRSRYVHVYVRVCMCMFVLFFNAVN